jgi:hypothetical protein
MAENRSTGREVQNAFSRDWYCISPRYCRHSTRFNDVENKVVDLWEL